MIGESRRSAALPRLPVATALVLASTALVPRAWAADPVFDPKPVAQNNEWIVTVNAWAQVAPSFIGSDRYSFFGYPTVRFRRAGTPEPFSAPDDGAGFAVYATDSFRIGPVVRIRPGRYSGSEGRLTGLDDVKFAVEPGVFVDFWPIAQVRARAELRYGLNGYEGFVGNLSLDYVQRIGQFTLSGGPRMALGSEEFTQAYFGVTPFEAFINPLVTTYRPSGGITSVGVAAAVKYDFSETFSTTVFGGYNRLTDDAADSPIVRSFGSRNQFSFGVNLAYSFKASGFSF